MPSSPPLPDQIVTIRADSSERLDSLLTKALELSRSHCQKLIKGGSVTKQSSEETIRQCSYKTHQGESFCIILPPPVDCFIEPENIPLTILYEDSDIIVINKPAGMVVHPAPGNRTGTLVNALLWHCKNSLSGINGVSKPGIVHRLDKFTSGIMIAAKNDAAHTCIASQIEQKTATRQYIAFCQGEILPRTFDIEAPIGRHLSQRTKMSISNKGRYARTTIHSLITARTQQIGTCTMLSCKLHTGRTHQIRVHCAHVRHPIINDTLYGGRNVTTVFPNIDHSRQALHAHQLTFTHPQSQEEMAFSAPLPQDLKDLHEQILSGQIIFRNAERYDPETFSI